VMLGLPCTMQQCSVLAPTRQRLHQHGAPLRYAGLDLDARRAAPASLPFNGACGADADAAIAAGQQQLPLPGHLSGRGGLLLAGNVTPPPRPATPHVKRRVDHNATRRCGVHGHATCCCCSSSSSRAVGRSCSAEGPRQGRDRAEGRCCWRAGWARVLQCRGRQQGRTVIAGAIGACRQDGGHLPEGKQAAGRRLPLGAGVGVGVCPQALPAKVTNHPPPQKTACLPPFRSDDLLWLCCWSGHAGCRWPKGRAGARGAPGAGALDACPDSAATRPRARQR